MKRTLILCFLLLFVSCDRDKSPLNATAPGVIQIVMSTERDGGTAAHKLSGGAEKTAAAAGLDNLEVRVLKSDNSVLASKVFTPVDGVFNVSMAVDALDNLKVLCIGTIGGVVEHFGLNEDVDVKPGKTTVVIIYGWYEPFRPEIGSIKPNPSQDGAYTVSWTQPPNTTTYILQEADNDKFSGVATVYSGADLQTGISGKTSGAYYYRVQASNQYLVKSGWSAISSEVVSISQRKYTISGAVSGADGVLVTLSGNASDSTRVDAGGTYTFTVNENGSYTVTASKAGFFFTPANKTFSALNSNQIQNFSATQITRTISGVISGADSVLVTLSGDDAGNQVVNNGGTYSFTVPEGGNYTVTPSKEGCAFTPSVGVFTNVRANITRDFAAALNKVTISGIVTGADSVLVTLSGDASEVQTVNDGGAYTFTVPQGKNFAVTPSKTGYVFTPESKIFSAVTVNQKQDFTASRIMRTISGTVTGASGVTVSLSGGASDSRVVSADGGSYSFSVPDGGSYTVTAIKSGYTLSPPSRTFTGIAADQTLNFTATRITHTISGTVTGADGVTVTLSGDASATQTVSGGGSYSFTVGEGGSYTVTPSKSGYVFTPASRTFTNVTAGQALSFTAQAQVIPATDVKMVSIPGGTFQMGSSSGNSDEQPVHTVTLTAFEISVYKITQGKYKAVIGTNPSYFTGDDNLPVEQVSWWDAIKFCNALSTKDGLEKCYDESTGGCDFTKNGYRLPTEAEWEYACRAGTTTNYYTGDTESDLARAGWYISNSSGKTHPVGQKTPNAWGLYDMHGNVYEWCNDWYGSYGSGSFTNPICIQIGMSRVVRGGSWGSYGYNCRSAFRDYTNPGSRSDYIGFRVVRREPSSLSSQYTISGLITGTDNVTVTLSGGLSGEETVNSGGRYSFSVDSGGEYTVTPSKSGYTFTPASKTFTNVTADQALNFTAVRITHTVSGTVTGEDGVTVTLSGDASATQTVSGGGSYSFTVGEGGSYTVTPSKTGYMFTPVARTFTNVTADQTLNFTAQAQVITNTDVKMVSIPGGTFSMGQTGIAEPVHSVTLSAFEMSTYEVTQGQYTAVIGSNPTDITGDDNMPVWNVSWWDAIKFCNALSAKAGLDKCYNESTGACDFTKNGFRLPTEAEWEYACRAGTTTDYYTGDSESDIDRAGWYVFNSSSNAHPVGQKTPNAWGLYDMHGNVWEWCNDWRGSYGSGNVTNLTGAQTGMFRVIRGGGWNTGGTWCQSAFRGYEPVEGGNGLGFRVVRRP